MTRGHLNGDGSPGPGVVSAEARLEDQAVSIELPWKMEAGTNVVKCLWDEFINVVRFIMIHNDDGRFCA
jgi:hypothetical protein